MALVLTACGGDSDSSTTVASISKAEYVKQADQICAKTEKRQLALLNTLQEEQAKDGKANGGKGSEVEMVIAAGLPPVRKQLEELTALPSPEGGASQINSYLKALEDGVTAVEDNPSSLLGLDTNPFAAAEAQAIKAGFKVCAGA